MPSLRPEVTMTSFMDYLQSAGGERLRQVRNQVEQYGLPYEVQRDYYRPMLIGLKESLKFATGTEPLDRALAMAPVARQEHFEEVRDGLKKFLAKKPCAQTSGAGRGTWVQPSVAIRVNPDFAHIDAAGNVHLVKVYFKRPVLRKFTAGAMIHLMDEVGRDLTPGTPAVLDARRGRLWTPRTASVSQVDLLLASEAMAYGALWQALSA